MLKSKCENRSKPSLKFSINSSNKRSQSIRFFNSSSILNNSKNTNLDKNKLDKRLKRINSLWVCNKFRNLSKPINRNYRNWVNNCSRNDNYKGECYSSIRESLSRFEKVNSMSEPKTKDYRFKRKRRSHLKNSKEQSNMVPLLKRSICQREEKIHRKVTTLTIQMFLESEKGLLKKSKPKMKLKIKK